MGLSDVLGKEDRVSITFSDFYALVKEAAKAELITNAVDSKVPNKHIQGMIYGAKSNIEEDK